MINAVAGLVLGYLFFQFVAGNKESSSQDDTGFEGDPLPPVQEISPQITTLNPVYFEGEYYLYHVEIDGYDMGHVIGNSSATGFQSQNTSSGAITFEYNGVTYTNVISYTYQSGVDWIDEQTNPPESSPDDPVSGGGDDEEFVPPTLEPEYGLGNNGGQFGSYFTA